MFTTDNTVGYTKQKIDALNTELAGRLEGIQKGTDAYYAIEQAFNDEVASR